MWFLHYHQFSNRDCFVRTTYDVPTDVYDLQKWCESMICVCLCLSIGELWLFIVRGFPITRANCTTNSFTYNSIKMGVRQKCMCVSGEKLWHCKFSTILISLNEMLLHDLQEKKIKKNFYYQFAHMNTRVLQELPFIVLGAS